MACLRYYIPDQQQYYSQFSLMYPAHVICGSSVMVLAVPVLTFGD